MFSLPDLFVITLLQIISQYVVWLLVIHPILQTSPIKLNCNECDSIALGSQCITTEELFENLILNRKYELKAAGQYAIC